MLVEKKDDLSIQHIEVIDALLEGSDLKNLDGIPASGYTFRIMDIRSPEILELGVDFDYVVNFAAQSHVDRSIHDPANFVSTNVMGVINLLELARQNENLVFIQVSTDEVYGSIIEGAPNELGMLNPSSPYSASKAAADLLVASYGTTYGIKYRITRCSNNYGIGQHFEKFIPSVIQSAARNLPICIYGNGQNRREWIHVDDHCRAILLVLQEGTNGEIYNVGTGEEISNLDLASLILEKIPGTLSQLDFVKDRAGHDFRYALDFRKIQDLGFKPSGSLKQNLPLVVEEYLSQINRA